MANVDGGEDDRAFGEGTQDTPRGAPVARQFVGATVRLSVYTALSSRMCHGESPQAMLQTLKNIASFEVSEGLPPQEVTERRLVKEFAEALLVRFETATDPGTMGPVLEVAIDVFEPKSLSFLEKVVLDVSREEFDQRPQKGYLDEAPHKITWRKVSEVLRDAAEVLRVGIERRK